MVMGYNSRWKAYFRVFLLFFIVLVLVWLALKAGIFWMEKTLSEQDDVLSGQNAQLQSYNEFTGFVKLQAVKELEGNYSEDIPWSTHIQKVIAMLGDIKNLDMSQDETLVLSDFNVSLDKLSVRGKVSNLLLLYYTSAEKGMTSLIDRFKKLDFISDMRIKNYTKNKDTGFFSFVLEANVNKDGK